MKATSIFSSLIGLMFLIVTPATTNAETDRAGHIDMLDAPTMQYFLNATAHQETPLDYDMVVLYYAQWCSNCRSLSPLYLQIAKILESGTSTNSQLVLAYFDCEVTYEHAQVCVTAGIEHYPTIQFISLAGTTGSKKKKKPIRLPNGGGKNLPPHVTQFSGNWIYGDSILDWIRTMRALSQWYRRGWLSLLRWPGSGSSGDGEELPIGVPPAARLETSLQQLQAEHDQTYGIARRSAHFVDALVTPNSLAGYKTADMTEPNTGLTYTDMFAVLDQNGHWFDATTPLSQVWRTCVVESGLDLCHRMNVQLAEEWVQLQPVPDVDYLTDEQLANYTSDTQAMMLEREPYCLVLEECVRAEFADAEVCRPATCPFRDPSKCRFLTACLTDDLMNDYAEALGVSLMADKSSAYSQQQQAAAASEEESSQPKKRWGMF